MAVYDGIGMEAAGWGGGGGAGRGGERITKT